MKLKLTKWFWRRSWNCEKVTDNGWSEKRTWTFGSGELENAEWTCVQNDKWGKMHDTRSVFNRAGTRERLSKFPIPATQILASARKHSLSAENTSSKTLVIFICFRELIILFWKIIIKRYNIYFNEAHRLKQSP